MIKPITFTPGPWASVKPKFFDPNCTRHVEDASGHLIARINFANAIQSENEAIANAHLIAAAPELLEALQEVVAISDRKHDAWDKAHAAIAKAKGENHE